MKKVVSRYPKKDNIPMRDRQLHVAAYCRVSTEHEEQDGSIELQEEYFRAVIDGNRNWTNAGIFTERKYSPIPKPGWGCGHQEVIGSA